MTWENRQKVEHMQCTWEKSEMTDNYALVCSKTKILFWTFFFFQVQIHKDILGFGWTLTTLPPNRILNMKTAIALPVAFYFSSCLTHSSTLTEESLLLWSWIKFNVRACKTRQTEDHCSLYLLNVLSAWNEIYERHNIEHVLSKLFSRISWGKVGT